MSHLVRYQITPVLLFRNQATRKVALRQKARQESLNRSSFDFKLHEDGKIHPTIGVKFTLPNGASCRPAGQTLTKIISRFNGNCIFVIPKGTPLPEELILIHEHTDHYSIQTAVNCSENELNERLSKFFEKMEMISKEYFQKKYSIFIK